jgi:acyl-CoA synthetase (AMP-forming)/AMP-acid ligase II
VIGSVGPGTGVEIRIADKRADGRGEVLIRGRSVMAAYEAVDTELNARAFVEGWFRTGDEGRLDDDGRLTLTGRLKELINRGGEKVRPQEIEDVIATHPGVKEVVVFAVPHARLGEEVAPVVIPTNDPPPLRSCGRTLATIGPRSKFRKPFISWPTFPAVRRARCSGRG